jgi:hypothetical protein
MARKQSDDTFSEREAARRFEAALQGAFKTPATPLKEVPPKRAKPQPKRPAKVRERRLAKP